MDFNWLKRFTPRSLYGRAALILLVPIVVIQVVVSVVFIQRHYEGVTRQMARVVVEQVGMLKERIDAAPTQEAAERVIGQLEPLFVIDATLPARVRTGDRVETFDLSGRQLIETVRNGIDGVTAVDVTAADKRVSMLVATRWGPLRVTFSRSRVEASNPHQLLVLMLVTSVLMTLIAALFLRNQMRPIKRLADAADAFGKGRSIPYKPSGAIEVRMAGTTFLDMRSRIERQIEQRTMMLSGVSHDLRTPLTRLKLGLSMMDDDDAEDLRGDVEDMERLLDEFLAFSRMDALDDPVPTDPVDLVRGLVETAARDGSDVRLVSVDGQGEAMLRPVAVGRALQNLIGNALRYAGKAEVSLTISGRMLRIAVEDDGPGIPANRREEALKPFARLDAARNQNRGAAGVGLGLAIAQDIARRHGGTLRLADSERLGGLKAELVLAR